MGQVRIVPREHITLQSPCSRCDAGEGPWDWIGSKAFCPACEEALLLGQIAPLIARTSPEPCVICQKAGTLCYTTLPLEAETPIQFELCAEHLRALLARRLGPHGYFQIRRELRQLGLEADDIFLLHDAFYDDKGHALAPIPEPE